MFLLHLPVGRGNRKAGWDVDGFKLDCLLVSNSVFRTVNVKQSNTALTDALPALIEMFCAVLHSHCGYCGHGQLEMWLV